MNNSREAEALQSAPKCSMQVYPPKPAKSQFLHSVDFSFSVRAVGTDIIHLGEKGAGVSEKFAQIKLIRCSNVSNETEENGCLFYTTNNWNIQIIFVFLLLLLVLNCLLCSSNNNNDTSQFGSFSIPCAQRSGMWQWLWHKLDFTDCAVTRLWFYLEQVTYRTLCTLNTGIWCVILLFNCG